MATTWGRLRDVSRIWILGPTPLRASDVEREIWDGRRPGLEGALEAFPIDVAHDIEDLESVLSAFLSNSRVAVTRLGVLPKVDRIVESALKAQSRDKQRYGQGPESVIDPTVRIGELRLIKSPAEIALMRHAAEITSLAHIEAMRHGGPTTGERQLQAILEGTFLALGAISGRTRASLVPESMRRSCTTSRMMPNVVRVMSYSSMQERVPRLCRRHHPKLANRWQIHRGTTGDLRARIEGSTGGNRGMRCRSAL